VDFNYDDTSGEVRDQRAEHEVSKRPSCPSEIQRAYSLRGLWDWRAAGQILRHHWSDREAGSRWLHPANPRMRGRDSSGAAGLAT